MSRYLIISDLHSGQWAGLNPDRFVDTIPNAQLRLSIRAGHAWFWHELGQYKRFDGVFANGDIIDGSGKRGGGRNLFTTDCNEQASMAIEVLEKIPSKKFYFIRGTEYHTGVEADFEDQIAKHFNSSIQNILDVESNGVKMNFRHHQGNSGVPYGAGTPTNKEAFWVNYLSEEDAKADLVVRSHVHRYYYGDDGEVAFLSTPAVQGWSSYGEKRCLGKIHQGFVVIETRDGDFTMKPHIRILNKRRKSDYVKI